ncbi:MAG: DUF4982 domain-containing protein [Bacteroidales bacterium]|nr:DUF4982 domain-containing protein [Bacteroidales bacterium]
MKIRLNLPIGMFCLLLVMMSCTTEKQSPRTTSLFNDGWLFMLSDTIDASAGEYDDASWRRIDLPHDWSIEGDFSPNHPATPGGGALPGGTGWYRKSFNLPENSSGKLVFIEFDGVYQNSEVWINGHRLGDRPYGYISFRYELTPFLNQGREQNVIAVKVDNSLQPNSRWYSGSGIYRDVRLVITGRVHVDPWGIFVTTPEVSDESAVVKVSTEIINRNGEHVDATLTSTIRDAGGRRIAESSDDYPLEADGKTKAVQKLTVTDPLLWSTEDPTLYCLVTEIHSAGRLVDRVETPFGIRDFVFDAETGFYLNGTPLKLKGVCNHHDLGCLGAAAYPRAIERQLEMLRQMGCNAIRTSHNPPSPHLLDLCDRMGFLVMDETFDMWKIRKTRYDYHLHWDKWHERDLRDHILRDRNHPSVILWSIGNEIIEQWDSTGTEMARELAAIVRELDDTRPITSGCNEASPNNTIIQSGALDVIGYNYHLGNFRNVPADFPGQPFIASETTSALATRGSYDMPSDLVRVWPVRWDSAFTPVNADQTCSAYDNCHVPWGSTHEQALITMNGNDFVSGMFVWTGFDYLGEPTPYWWPSRSSYFGIIDLAGFPKDAFYLYQSEWTGQPVLHLFPHWNWNPGDTVDLWTYTCCDEVELFLNGGSLGVKTKEGGSLHMQWRVPWTPGKLEAKGIYQDKELISVVETTGPPASIRLTADREKLDAGGRDLSFITVEIVDENGLTVPDADNTVSFRLEGPGEIIGVDNGSQTSLESFKAEQRKAFNGLCLAVIKSGKEPGTLLLKAESEGLESASLKLKCK